MTCQRKCTCADYVWKMCAAATCHQIRNGSEAQEHAAHDSPPHTDSPWTSIGLLEPSAAALFDGGDLGVVVSNRGVSAPAAPAHVPFEQFCSDDCAAAVASRDHGAAATSRGCSACPRRASFLLRRTLPVPTPTHKNVVTMAMATIGMPRLAKRVSCVRRSIIITATEWDLLATHA
jgi:hypothetical protein